MAIAGRTARRAALPGWTGAPAVLADTVLAIGILVGSGRGARPLRRPRRSRAVRREPDHRWSRAAARADADPGGRRGACAAHPCAGERRGGGEREAPPVSRIEIGVAVLLALIVAAQWAGPTLLTLDRGIYGGDSLWYHMPLAAHIAQDGSITSLLFTDPLYLNWFYPQVSELLHGTGILLFGNDFLSPLVNLGWLGLALFAGWCIGRPYGTGATAMAAVASVMSADLLFCRQPGNANNDVAAIALFLCSVAMLVNTRLVALGCAPFRGPARRRPGCRPGARHEADRRPSGTRAHGRRHLPGRARARGCGRLHSGSAGSSSAAATGTSATWSSPATHSPGRTSGRSRMPRRSRGATPIRWRTTSPTATSGAASSPRRSRSASAISGPPTWCSR